jgi:hypothetical protein
MMAATNAISAQRKFGLIIPFVSSLLIVLILSYVDEGYYDFRWMRDPGSWVAFGLLITIFFAMTALIYNFVLGSLKGSLKTVIMLGVITPGIILLIFGLLG